MEPCSFLPFLFSLSPFPPFQFHSSLSFPSLSCPWVPSTKSSYWRCRGMLWVLSCHSGSGQSQAGKVTVSGYQIDTICRQGSRFCCILRWKSCSRDSAIAEIFRWSSMHCNPHWLCDIPVWYFSEKVAVWFRASQGNAVVAYRPIPSHFQPTDRLLHVRLLSSYITARFSKVILF